ncbi:hypothetical protein D910_06817 [Dendroctonus ponderosae]|uniref:C2H2-type domain-containing protein n=1 Tax=Dendroctonus ponderosae TaxID=77166 RepID=U4UHU7_DENPD|nr:hypothetical protein D910_06817 [Dendroctonus ponderosae]
MRILFESKCGFFNRLQPDLACDSNCVHEKNNSLSTSRKSKFQCNVCRTIFKRKGGLNQHTKYFCGKEATMSCPVSTCRHRSKTNFNLRKHLLAVHGIKTGRKVPAKFEPMECHVLSRIPGASKTGRKYCRGCYGKKLNNEIPKSRRNPGLLVKAAQKRTNTANRDTTTRSTNAARKSPLSATSAAIKPTSKATCAAMCSINTA